MFFLALLIFCLFFIGSAKYAEGMKELFVSLLKSNQHPPKNANDG